MQRPSHFVTMPATRTTPVVFASPHSGRDYTRAFQRASVLDQNTLRSSEDAFVDELFSTVPKFGAPLICATVPRAYVDLNRGAEELDPALIKGARKVVQNPRISSGLGVIPRVVAAGREIYRGKLALAEAEARIRDHWYPYHARLSRLMKESLQLFGKSILIDCHSMPHEAIETLCHHHKVKPEVVLGDRFGTSAGAEIVDRIEASFASAGLRVVRNKPFAGAYTAQRYGRPSRGQHVVQIEIDRSLYMNEALILPNDNYSSMHALISGVTAEICAAGAGDVPLAAE